MKYGKIHFAAFFSILVFLCCQFSVAASAPAEKGNDQKITVAAKYILTHSLPGNPRNSEGSFVKLADGTLYFAYSRYNGSSAGDHGAADIAAVTSKDNGKSWSKPFTVVKNRSMNVMSVSLLRLHSGVIAMVYMEKSAVPGWNKFVDCRPKICFSADETRSWSRPVEIANVPPSYFVVNNDRMIQLKNGRLIIPAAQHQYGHDFLNDGVIKFFISDDEGKTWRFSKQNIYPVTKTVRGFMEPGVIELANGTLMCFIRTAAGCQYKSFSSDQGDSWSDAVPYSEFLSPESPMSMKRDPVSGKIYAIWNDHSALNSVRSTEFCWGRTPLAIAESSDEGKTWHNVQLLESSPNHGYCYTAIYFDGGLLHLGYCSGGEASCSNMLQDTTLMTLKLR